MPETASDTLVRFDTAVNSARRALYRFASLALADPASGCWTHLADRLSHACIHAACELVRAEPGAIAGSLGPGEAPLDQLDPAAMLSKLPGSVEALNTEYERTFGLLLTAGCPPYETEFIDGKLSFQRSQHLADVAGFYRAFGMEPQVSHPERPDHITLELEFMATLIGLESRTRDNDQFAVCRDAQAQFLKSHLAWWVPSFARLLTREHPDGFYAAVGKFLSVLMPAERALLGVSAVLQPAAPSLLERPEECEGCLVHGPASSLCSNSDFKAGGPNSGTDLRP